MDAPHALTITPRPLSPTLLIQVTLLRQHTPRVQNIRPCPLWTLPEPIAAILLMFLNQILSDCLRPHQCVFELLGETVAARFLAATIALDVELVLRRIVLCAGGATARAVVPRLELVAAAEFVVAFLLTHLVGVLSIGKSCQEADSTI